MIPQEEVWAGTLLGWQATDCLCGGGGGDGGDGGDGGGGGGGGGGGCLCV